VVVSWLLRLLLVILIVRAVWRLLSGILEGATRASPAAPGGNGRAVPLVRDPVCGTFVVAARSLSSGAGGDTRYFCSERCRDAYRKEPDRGRASVGQAPDTRH
jgi:YHS domain-containing protein